MSRLTLILLPLCVGVLLVIVTILLVDRITGEVGTQEAAEVGLQEESTVIWMADGFRADGFSGPIPTDEDFAAARVIAESDPLIADVLTLTTFTVISAGAWVEGDEMIGVAALASLGTPQTIEADWPFVPRDSSGKAMRSPDGTVITRSEQYRVHDLTQVTLTIDLREGRVAQIFPITYSEIDRRR